MESTLGFRERSYKFESFLLLFLSLLLLLYPISTEAADVTSTLMIGGSRIDVTIDERDAPLPQAEVMKWVKNAAESVATYYGHFPVPHLTLRVVSFEGSGVRHGTTWGKGGGLIRIFAGSKTTAEYFADDWMLTHEMVHLAFPSMMGDEHHWIEEGSAVYVEPIARIRAGHWTALQMWHDLVRDMPKGEPQAGDEGLDHTHTWGRTYWGGALFCFVADVEIRKQTKNKKGLEDALRGVLNAGGDIRVDWDLDKALKVGDQAVGLDVLEKLYAEWKDKPVQVDLPAIWKELGVEVGPDSATVTLNNDAPMAALRRAIEMGTPAGKSAGQASDGTSPSKKEPGATAARPLAVFVGRTARSS
ncbi:MAG TPA: hypothetical protein VMI32_04665 [Candidatus Solibacter sp.]|nr:hypothetical protein [Candidatus Solibacter sp.]